MLLRKKHVRRAVLAALAIGVLGPLVGLGIYAAWLRSGAYGEGVAAALASRLRCEAQVVRGRPTGPSGAAADEVRLAWTAGAGRLALDLRDIRAERTVYGWSVVAGEGRLALAAEDPASTLAALNHRLVQMDHPAELMAVAVGRLAVRLETPHLACEVRGAARAESHLTRLTCHLAAPADAGGERAGGTPLVSVRLNPTSEGGVFEALRADLRHLRLDEAAPVLGGAGAADAGEVDLVADWGWTDPAGRAADVRAVFRGAALERWTAGLPGGPVRGTAEAVAAYARPAQGSAVLTVEGTCEGGSVHGDTLAWLQGLGVGLYGTGARFPGQVDFDRLRLVCRAADGRARFEGDRLPGSGHIPLMVTHVLGFEIPLVWSTGRPFEGRRLWTALARPGGEP